MLLISSRGIIRLPDKADKFVWKKKNKPCRILFYIYSVVEHVFATDTHVANPFLTSLPGVN